MYPHRSILEKASATYEINKSIFICHAKPVTTVAEAQAYIEEIKKQYADARHNCSAYIIGKDQHYQKANDDGEPSGTAGVPMLEVLKKQNLTNLVVVVTRYFGGIKLGAGGLIRAYGKAVTLGLDAATMVNYEIEQCYKITFPYNLMGSLENYLSNQEIPIKSREFTQEVEFVISLPLGETAILTELNNLASGQLITEELDQELIPKQG